MTGKGLKIPRMNSKGRMTTAIAFVLLFFVYLVGNLGKMQIIEHDSYAARASNQQLRNTVISADRGTIYDSNMNILARSATVWTVAIVPKVVNDKEYDINAFASFLAEKLDVDYDSIVEKCADSTSQYSIIKRKVDKPVVDEIQSWMYENHFGGGITFTEDTKRYYPYSNLAAQVLGFVGTDNNGLYGLESYYDRELSGVSGRLLTAVNAQGGNVYYEYETVTEARDGYDLVLTIDVEIQKILEEALEEACREHNVKNYACGIVMNVNTGEIYAMAVKPDYDPNDPLEIYDENTAAMIAEITDSDERKSAYAAAQENQWINKAVSDIYEPGSVFKVVTASAALETGAFDLNSKFYCTGYKQVTGSIGMYCANHGGHGSEDFTHAVINSCNPAFIEMGLELGKDTFYDYFRSFGLSEKTGIDLPYEVNSSHYTDKNMGIVELASSSYGQSNAVTPIQMITAFSAVANGGYLVQPYVVKQILDSEGNVVENVTPTVKRQVISKEISETMCGILEQVIEESSGSNAYVAGFRIGGKSGTAEKLNSTSEETEYVSSLCAFAPCDNPEVACLILLDGARSYSIFGGVIVAPIVSKVMSQVLPYLGVEAVYSEDELANTDVKVPNVRDYSLTNAYAAMQKRGLSYKVIGNGTSVIGSYPVSGTSIPKGSVVFLYTDETEPKDIEVPNVYGYSVSYVKSLFESLGLNLKINGSHSSGAVAMNQSVAEGALVREGSLITVTFIEHNVND